MRSTAWRARPATAGSTVTSSLRNTSDSRIFGSVMRFICGQRLHGRTNSTLGASTATLSLIEHSVTSSTLRRLVILHPFDHAGGRAGEVGLGEHVGRAFRVRDDLHAGVALAIGAELLAGEALMHLAMALPGDDLDLGLGLHPFGEIFVGDHDHPRRPSDSTTRTAFEEVQQMSDSAFTSAEVLT